MTVFINARHSRVNYVDKYFDKFIKLSGDELLKK